MCRTSLSPFGFEEGRAGFEEGQVCWYSREPSGFVLKRGIDLGFEDRHVVAFKHDKRLGNKDNYADSEDRQHFGLRRRINARVLKSSTCFHCEEVSTFSF